MRKWTLAGVLCVATAVGSCWTAQPPGEAGNNWHTYEAPDGTFRMLLPPGRPSIRHLVHGNVRRTDYSSREGTSTLMVQVFETDEYTPEHAADLLRNYPNPEAGGVNGRVVSDSAIQFGRYPGRAVRIEGTSRGAPGLVVLVQRAYVANSRIYLVTGASAPGQPLTQQANRFLESFTILK